MMPTDEREPVDEPTGETCIIYVTEAGVEYDGELVAWDSVESDDPDITIAVVSVVL